MSWNYRVFRARYRSTVAPAFFEDTETYEEDLYTIREVYYGDEGAILGITAGSHGTTAVGNTKQELQDILQKMLSETVWSVLTSHDIPGYTFDRNEVEIPKHELER